VQELATILDECLDIALRLHTHNIRSKQALEDGLAPQFG
jgi:hypothetical protein